MVVYTTPFGLLNENGKLDNIEPARIQAEVRGLELLQNILDVSETWQPIKGQQEGRTSLAYFTETRELRIHVMETVEQFLLVGDTHLWVIVVDGKKPRFFQRNQPVCILFDESQHSVAISDAIISLVLLAESNWPTRVTPDTLKNFAIHARRYQAKRRLNMGKIITNTDDVAFMEQIHAKIKSGTPNEVIGMICAFARKCYTCKGMEFDEIQEHLKALFALVTTEEMKHYSQHPLDASDVLFLPKMLESA